MPTGPSWPSRARKTSTKLATMRQLRRARAPGCRWTSDRPGTAAPSGLPPGTGSTRARRARPSRGTGKRSSARRMCPPGSPSCSRARSTVSSAVPETTPSWPSAGDGAGEPPVGDADAHAALDDDRSLVHRRRSIIDRRGRCALRGRPHNPGAHEGKATLQWRVVVRALLAAVVLAGAPVLQAQSASAPLIVTATVVSTCKVDVPRSAETSTFATMPVAVTCAKGGATPRVQRPVAPRRSEVRDALLVIDF